MFIFQSTLICTTCHYKMPLKHVSGNIHIHKLNLESICLSRQHVSGHILNQLSLIWLLSYSLKSCIHYLHLFLFWNFMQLIKLPCTIDFDCGSCIWNLYIFIGIYLSSSFSLPSSVHPITLRCHWNMYLVLY